METPPPIAPTRPMDQSKPDRTWEVLCHAAAFSGFIGLPFGSILGPLIVWSMKREEMPSVNEHGKESLNFQLTCGAAMLALGLIGLMFVVGALIPLVGLVFVVLIWVLMAVAAGVAVACFVLTLIATIKAGNGELYRYPFTIRFIK